MLTLLFEVVIIFAFIFILVIGISMIHFFLFVDAPVSKKMKRKYGKHWFNEYTSGLYILLTNGILSEQVSKKEHGILFEVHTLLNSTDTDEMCAIIDDNRLCRMLIEHIEHVIEYSKLNTISYFQACHLINCSEIIMNRLDDIKD